MNEQNRKILVAEYDDCIRNILRRILALRGYEMEGVSSARKALEKLKCESYALVIADTQLVDFYGLQLLERIRKKNPDLPVIITSGFLTSAKREFFREKGAYDFIVKPFKIDHFLDTVHEAIWGTASGSQD